ncbi:MAG TPA: tRNA epoxyqueuosine(34) reductase QueG [Hyphomicrobium sp.]|nr:tRNA epoxyqueuosine(34) reductase QueG [Hyphomicrobium sp.]
MMPAEPHALKAFIQEHAARLGLDAVGFTTPGAIASAAPRLTHFLDEGRHGDMGWMAETAERRSSPSTLWPQARSVIMIGQNYAPDADPLLALQEPSSAIVSVYAKGKDYHDVLKAKIRSLAGEIARAGSCDVKIFVDTAPLMEKPLAAAAGLGWQGKHTNLVSRTHGSWLFLGAILTTAELPADPPEANHCGSCRRCLDVCPTQAFPAPYQLDARRCLAYLSIEHKGHIPREFRTAMANRVFGCDDCLAVCPWNKFAAASRETKYAARAETDNPPIAELLAIDDPAFRKRFAGTPVKRTGRDRIVRNALIAAGNSGDTAYLPAITALLEDGSSLVRAMAVWALSRLAPADAFDALKAHHASAEPDPDVRLEWTFTETGPK